MARFRVRCLAVAVLGILARSAFAATDLNEQNYLQHCSGCHMMDGTGSAANQVPTMLGSVGHFVRTPTGRDFLVQIAGVAQAPLTDQALADLLNWLLPKYGGAELPADFKPYTAAEVQTLRSTRPADLNRVRTQLARELADRGFTIANY